MIQPVWKMVRRFLKRLGIKPPYYPAIPLLSIYPEETKSLQAINAGEGVEKRELSYTVGGNTN